MRSHIDDLKLDEQANQMAFSTLWGSKFVQNAR